MPNTFLKYALFALLAGIVGCHAPGFEPLVSTNGPVTRSEGQHVQSEVAVTIRWPYRAQVLPTSAQFLSFVLNGPTSQNETVFRPEGSSPTSTATLSVEVGNGYVLSVQAYDNAPTPRLVASGTSGTFNVKANERTSVTVALSADYVPAVTGFTPDNGGPGATVEVYGANFGQDRGFTPGFTFGGVPVTVVYPPQDGTVSVLVPMTGLSGFILPRVDGVTGNSTGSFTVLKSLGLSPDSLTVASGSSVVFTALATTSEDVEFTATPSVTWSVSRPISSLPITNAYRIQVNGDGSPDASTESVSVGTIDQLGRFTASATGSAEISIRSGTLMATASVTVTD